MSAKPTGWFPSHDQRRAAFPMRAALPRAVVRRGITHRYRYWYAGWRGDQGNTSSCVSYATLHAYHGSPNTHRGVVKPATDPMILYREGQLRDPWPEPPEYEGTSTDAVASAMRDRGMITSFHWAESIDDVVLALAETSGVIAGTWWYAGMDEVDERGFVHPTGRQRGGHAFWLDGINLDREEIRLSNSWGSSWGINGRGRISIPDFESLFYDYGEVCILTE